jgi:hypothetical protein
MLTLLLGSEAPMVNEAKMCDLNPRTVFVQLLRTIYGQLRKVQKALSARKRHQRNEMEF